MKVNNISFKGFALDKSIATTLSPENRDKLVGVYESVLKHPEKDIFISSGDPDAIKVKVQKANPLDLLITNELVNPESEDAQLIFFMKELNKAQKDIYDRTPLFYEDEIIELNLIDEDTVHEMTEDIIKIFDDIYYNPDQYN